MKNLEEFFKNRILCNMEESYNNHYLHHGFCNLHDEFKYSSTIHNAQSLNIKTTFDLIEKLTPLFKYISSNIERFIKEDEEYCPNCYFSIGTFVKFTCNEVQNNYINNEWYTNYVILFQLFFGIGGLTGDMDIFGEIMEDIKKRIEENPYNLIFNINLS